MQAGKTIKYHRIKSNKTQDELATGLISVSYLSKIENEKINPHPEIIEELLLRLGIKNYPPLDDERLREEIMNWYQTMVNKSHQFNTETKYLEIKEKVQYSSSLEVTTLFNLISIRYHLLTGHSSQAEKVIKDLDTVHTSLNNVCLYYFYKFSGNLQYMKNQFQAAYTFYKKAEALVTEPQLHQFEKGDIYYSLGLTASQLLKHYTAIDYANLALESFRKIYYKAHSSDCHLLLGLLHQKIQEYDQAAGHYKWAQTLAEEEEYHASLGIIEHNLGYFRYLQGNYTAALTHYQKSLQLKTGNTSSQIKTIVCILKVYYQLKDLENIKKWVKKAQSIQSEQIELAFKYEIEFFDSFVHEDYERIVLLMKKTAIPYFEQEGFYQKAYFYSEILAEYYKKNRKYKLAMFYLEYCNKLLKNKINISILGG